MILIWLNSFTFPAKRLRKKIRALELRFRVFCVKNLYVLQVLAVQNTPIFPPKDLEKIQAPKIRMRRFFFFNIQCIIAS